MMNAPPETHALQQKMRIIGPLQLLRQRLVLHDITTTTKHSSRHSSTISTKAALRMIMMMMMMMMMMVSRQQCELQPTK